MYTPLGAWPSQCPGRFRHGGPLGVAHYAVIGPPVLQSCTVVILDLLPMADHLGSLLSPKDFPLFDCVALTELRTYSSLRFY